MKRIFIAIFYTALVLCVVVFNTNAQTKEKILIQGKIIGSKDKLPVIGATVIEQDKDKRTITGVATNIDGAFAIKVTNPANKLVISIIGYKAKTLDIGSRRAFNITLDPNTSDLSEVTITAGK